MLDYVLIFVVSLFMVVHGATLATEYAARLAKKFRVSAYTVGFIIIAIISILPEAFIAVNSAIEKVPSFGLGMLFGSNIADLTLIFAGIIFLARRGLKIEGATLKRRGIYPFLLLTPIALGLDGHFSRFEGIALMIVGAAFYYVSLRREVRIASMIAAARNNGVYKAVASLILSMIVLLVGAHFTVTSAVAIANALAIKPVVIGMLVVGLGTTLPEFFFSLKAIRRRDDSLAVGDILGTVLADSTIVVGLLAVVNPFEFPKKIVYITGLFMVAAAFVLFRFMRSDRRLSKKEAWGLVAFWLVFVIVELVANV